MNILYFLTTCLLVLAAWSTQKIDLRGAMTGGLITFLLLLGCGWLGLWLIGAFFISGTLASVWKIKEKHLWGVAEKNAAKRGILNVLSNALVPGICGLMAFLYPENQPLFEMAAAAGFASATADTLSSEMGNVYGSRFINIVSLKNEERGKDGAISPEGTLFGLLGSGIITLIYAVGRGFHGPLLIIFIAGVSGNFIDSMLGATLQRQGVMNNHSVNFANTLFASLFVLGLEGW